MRAVLGVDVQPTFCEEGGLAVVGGNAVAAAAGKFLADNIDEYDAVATSQDWHIDPGEHWAREGETPDFNVSWPIHGAAGTEEAELHPDFVAAFADEDGHAPIDFRVYKGMGTAAYSAFEGIVGDAPTDVDATGPGLAEVLGDAGVTTIDVFGIATDHCVLRSVLDALDAGFDVRVITDLCVGVDAAASAAALEEMVAAGAALVTTDTAFAGVGR